MAWTTPRTWADGEIPTAALMNTHIKDNLNAVSTHTHSGAAGDGSAALSGVDTITLADQGSTPSAPGSSKLVLFSESGILKQRVGAAGAATIISVTGHGHTIEEKFQADSQDSLNEGTDSTYGSLSAATATNRSAYTTAEVSITRTPGAANRALVITASWFCILSYATTGGVSGTLYIRIMAGASQKVEVSAAKSYGSLVSGGHGELISTYWVEEDAAVSSVAWTMQDKVTGIAGDEASVHYAPSLQLVEVGSD